MMGQMMGLLNSVQGFMGGGRFSLCMLVHERLHVRTSIAPDARPRIPPMALCLLYRCA